MSVVSFQTPGLIDPRCISTIGVSVKEHDNPIGRFGTGLKYAIAIILRSGGEISIWRGLEEFRFTARPVQIRGKDVQVVYMNDLELGFTTHLGSHWQMWQAFRELYCNTLDEEGAHLVGELAPAAGQTTTVVQLEEFANCARNMGDHILITEPVHPGIHASFHPGPSRSIFYKGVKVGSIESEHPCRFAVNIHGHLDLTEDRTLKGAWQVYSYIAQEISGSRDAQFIEQFVGADREYAEHGMDVDWPGLKPSPEFMTVVENLARDTSRPMNPSALKKFRAHAPAPRPIQAELTGHEQQMLAQSIATCRSLRFPVDEYRITIVDSLGPRILGRAIREDREILIARECFEIGEGMLASTLIEEWAHIKHGFNDCTREMQNWLFNSLLNLGRSYLFEKARADQLESERQVPA